MKLNLNRIEEPFVLELLNEDGNSCIVDANPAIGGKGKGFRPMELLAGSLAACVSIDVINILKKQRYEPANYTVQIEAKRTEGIPSLFQSIHLVFEFDSSLNEEKARKIIELTLAKYCSVSASLKEEIEITYDVEMSYEL